MVGGAETAQVVEAKAGLRLRISVLARALRLHQWLKNVLIFVPLVTSHRALEPVVLIPAVLAFFAFSAVASAGYVVNDILDLGSDRKHATKRLRPFASGALQPRAGLWLAASMIAAAAGLALLLPRAFALLLAGYFAVTLAYSLRLKAQPILDVLVLATLYTSRIAGGGLATGIPVTEWLAAWSMFLFLSLSFLKRASEMARSDEALHGRGYLPEDRDSIFGMGIASGYLSVLVLALYISSDQVKLLYRHPDYLWGLCALMLYWISRLWLHARRGLVRDDPIIFALGDRTTYLLGPIGAIILVLATG